MGLGRPGLNLGPEGKRSIWVFYDDPSWEDTSIIHRWGYAPNSLATVMSATDLIELT